MQLFVVRPFGMVAAAEDEDVGPWMAWHGIADFPMKMRQAAKVRSYFVEFAWAHPELALAFVGNDFCSVLHFGSWSVYRDMDDAVTDIYGLWGTNGCFEAIPCLLHD